MDICQAKYIDAISQKQIVFRNKIENDTDITGYIEQFVQELNEQKAGFEIVLKACLYNIIALLIRRYVCRTLTQSEYEIREQNLKRFDTVFDYISCHYNEKISVDQLCAMVNLSRYYFCRTFKAMTGEPVMRYINLFRLSKADSLLRSGDMSVTDAALACGFSDPNYFSRLYKKYRHLAPSETARSE